MRRRDPSQARRLEVLLVRRLPAHAPRLRGRAARDRRRRRDRVLPRGDDGEVGGPVRRLARRGVDHDRRTTSSGSTRSASSRGCSSRSAPARRPAASRRSATSPTCASGSRWSTRARSTSRRSETSTPIADHVQVDLELRGCPISKAQLVETVLRAAQRPARRGSRRRASASSARRAARPCVMVAGGTPCLGPVTQAGCGAICPAYDRGCYGCFGPMESPNMPALAAQWRALGAGDDARSCARSEPSMPTRRRSGRRA